MHMNTKMFVRSIWRATVVATIDFQNTHIGTVNARFIG